MKKCEQLYEGKAKKVFATEMPANDHQRRRRRSRRRNRAQRDRLRNRQLVVSQDEMQHHQRDIDKYRRRQRLNDADNRRLSAGFAQRGKSEFVADCKRDKAQRHFAEHFQPVQLLHGFKADSRNAQPAKAIRPDQHAGYQICRDRRQRKALDHAGHHQSSDNRHGKGQKCSHVSLFSLVFLFKLCYYKNKILRASMRWSKFFVRIR